MAESDIHKIIRLLERHVEQFDDYDQRLVRDMAASLDERGECFTCTLRQSRRLRWLAFKIEKGEEKPKSRLEELKEKRDKLFKSIRRRARKVEQINAALAGGLERVLPELPLTVKATQETTMKRRVVDARKTTRAQRFRSKLKGEEE